VRLPYSRLCLRLFRYLTLNSGPCPGPYPPGAEYPELHLCVPPTLSAGGGIPRATPLRAPDPIRRGRNTQSCTFACPRPYPPGAEYPELQCCPDAATGMAIIGRRCVPSTAIIASLGRVNACCDGGGVFSLEARERCLASRSFSRTMSACAVPAALLLSWRFLAVLLRSFSSTDLPRLRVCFCGRLCIGRVG
jgi:hypothetical protein